MLLRIVQLRALQDALLGADGEVPAQVRKIGSEQNLVQPRHIAQQAQYWIAGSERSVPVNLAEHVGGWTSFFASGDEPHFVNDGEARGRSIH